MTLGKYFRKFMGWCLIKNFIKKEGKKDGCFSFELEKWGQPVPSPTDLQEGKILKGLALYRGYRIVKIIVTSLIISLILGLYSPADSFFHLFSFLIPYWLFGLNPL